MDLKLDGLINKVHKRKQALLRVVNLGRTMDLMKAKPFKALKRLLKEKLLELLILTKKAMPNLLG